MTHQFKKLDEPDLVRLQAIEKDLGCCIVALERGPKFASISETQLRRLQSLEQEIDAIVLAYEC
jgi:hypothetical protein